MNSDRAQKISSDFLIAANRAAEIQIIDDHFQDAKVPAIVCAAFSIELGLKSAIHKESGTEHKNEHKIFNLFEKLSTGKKEEISKVLGIDLEELKVKVSGISNAFVEWRYVYERDRTEIDFTFLFNFAKAVQNITTPALLSNWP